MGGWICKYRNINPKRGHNGQRPRGTLETNANSVIIGRSNQNPILDECLLEVEFLGVEMTELADNVIAESMYSQCDVDGNEYLSLEAFVNVSSQYRGPKDSC